MCVCILSHLAHIWLFAILWTAAHQAPLFIVFSRQEFWSGFPCPPLGDFPTQGSNPHLIMSPALAGIFFTTGPPRKPRDRHLGISTSGTQNPSFSIYAYQLIWICLSSRLPVWVRGTSTFLCAQTKHLSITQPHAWSTSKSCWLSSKCLSNSFADTTLSRQLWSSFNDNSITGFSESTIVQIQSILLSVAGRY